MSTNKSVFQTSHSLSEIVEESWLKPVIIFKYSSDCNSSALLRTRLKKALEENIISVPIYLITVQKQKALSENISKHFDIRHESPQIIILNKGHVTYTAHHGNIKIEDFVF